MKTLGFTLCFISIHFLTPLFAQEGKTIVIDTVFVNTTVNTVIMFPSSVKRVTVDPGSKDYAGVVKGAATVFLRAATPNGQPAGLYIRYDDKYYNATIAYKTALTEKEQYIDLTGINELPEAINKDREITDESESIETQLMNRRLGILEGRKKDKYKSVATIYEKTLILKFSDIMQDDDFLYLRLGLFNKDKKREYVIDGIEYMYRNTGDERDYKQEFERVPNQTKIVPPGVGANIITAIPKYNITSKWVLSVTVREKDGSRKLSVNIPFDYIDKAEKFE